MKEIKKEISRLWLREAKSLKELSTKVTHLGIGAHSDDLEIIGLDGIIKHFKNKKNNFFGILVSDNQGKPIHPKYKSFSLSKVQEIREEEQIKAARLGEYVGLVFLRHPSNFIKNHPYQKITENELREIIELLRPQVIYTHSPFDKHPTHVAIVLRVVSALRKLPENKRPKKIYGVEVWGSLDWLSEKERIVFDLSGYEKLISRLLKKFKSQRYGLHKYDEAILSRMYSNAVFAKTHQFSKSAFLEYALDLTPLIKNKNLKIKKFMNVCLANFSNDVFSRIKK